MRPPGKRHTRDYHPSRSQRTGRQGRQNRDSYGLHDWRTAPYDLGDLDDCLLLWAVEVQRRRLSSLSCCGDLAVSGDDQVNALRDEPETEDQAPCDDHLVGVGLQPGPEPGQERLALAGPEAGVGLYGQVGGRGQDAEQGQREVILPAGQFGLHDGGSARAYHSRAGASGPGPWRTTGTWCPRAPATWVASSASASSIAPSAGCAGSRSGQGGRRWRSSPPVLPVTAPCSAWGGYCRWRAR